MYDDRWSQIAVAEEVIVPALFWMMALVVIGFGALALTGTDTMRATHPGTRAVVTGTWLAFVLAGWLATAWIVTRTPGGADVAWAWVRSQAALAQAAIWLLLLPWTATVWILQSSWPGWVQITAVGALATATIGLTLAQFAEALRRLRN